MAISLQSNYAEAYYISSLTESAQVFAKIIRGHWKIENQLHCLLRFFFSLQLLSLWLFQLW